MSDLDRLVPAVDVTSRPVRRLSRRVREAGLGYLLILPSLLAFVIFLLNSSR